VQLPLPPHLDAAPVIAAIDPRKDVDGLTAANISLLWSGGQGLFPCTPLGCLLLLKAELGALDGLHAVVLGRSQLVGKPVSALLLQENCTVSIAHSRSRQLDALCRTGDILISATGHAELVRGSWIKPGATVIDVGITRVDTSSAKSRLVGDVAFEEALAVAGAITPVPGGVGPMTIACLLRNTLTAACRQAGIADPPV
jgi:methylenetetrahydrofolate dehydrogenase (NADP+)/methenyltetrahydrofolate cyclohydrolase